MDMKPIIGMALCAAAAAAGAQQAGMRRTELQRHDASIPGHEVVQVRVELDPGHGTPRHTHPGDEIVYVLDGTIEYEVGGGAPRTLTAGQAAFVPAGAVHAARNAASSAGNGKAAQLIATYVVEKGKPLLAPAK